MGRAQRAGSGAHRAEASHQCEPLSEGKRNGEKERERKRKREEGKTPRTRELEVGERETFAVVTDWRALLFPLNVPLRSFLPAAADLARSDPLLLGLDPHVESVLDVADWR